MGLRLTQHSASVRASQRRQLKLQLQTEIHDLWGRRFGLDTTPTSAHVMRHERIVPIPLLCSPCRSAETQRRVALRPLAADAIVANAVAELGQSAAFRFASSVPLIARHGWHSGRLFQGLCVGRDGRLLSSHRRADCAAGEGSRQRGGFGASLALVSLGPPPDAIAKAPLRP